MSIWTVDEADVLPEVPAARLWERAGYPDESLRPDQLTTKNDQ